MTESILQQLQQVYVVEHQQYMIKTSSHKQKGLPIYKKWLSKKPLPLWKLK